GECVFGTELACNDDADPAVNLTSRMVASNLTPGAYYIVLDTFNADVSGPYILDVHGTIAPNERCDPTMPFLSCDHSVCEQGICNPPHDCPDLLDNDGDGMIDEDTCTRPPRVTCSSDLNVVAGTQLVLTGTAMDEGTLVSEEWETIRSPLAQY